MPAAALPCVVVGAAALCEQVPNGRSINYNCTACQPTLGKKPIKDWEKPLTLWKNKAHGFHAMRTGGKNIALLAGWKGLKGLFLQLGWWSSGWGLDV